MKKNQWIMTTLILLAPFIKAGAFYDASVETQKLVRNLKTDYGVVGIGEKTDSENLQKAIDDVSTKGGGVIQIPAGEYWLSDISLKSNIHLEIDKDVVIKPVTEGLRKSISIFKLGADGSPIENISIRGVGGRYTVQLPAYKPGIRVFSLKYVRNFLISDVNITDNLTKFSCFQLGTEAKSKKGIWRPTQGTIANADVKGAHYGYGLVQVQAAESVLFENLSGTGGLTLRMETGAKNMNDSQIGGVDNLIAKNISCTDGNAAVGISPHSMKNGVVKVDGVKSVGCGFAVRIGKGFISQKQTTPDLEAGTFAEGCSVKNVDATFGMNAQLKEKHYKYMPSQLKEYNKTESEDGASHRGPSIAAVLNDANYKVTVENVTAHGFKYNPPVLTEKNAK